MDFLRNHAHLAGGDTRKAPKNTQFSKSRHTPRGQDPPPRQPLSIHQITANPLNPFQPKYPQGPIPQRSDLRHLHPLDEGTRQPRGITVPKTHALVLLVLAGAQLELPLYAAVVPGTLPNFNIQKCPGRTCLSSCGDQSS